MTDTFVAKNYQVAGKQTCIFFLLPTASSFLIASLQAAEGEGVHMAGGGMHRGGGGMHVHPVHPPWVRHCQESIPGNRFMGHS
jgi:hypothetical protein